MKALITLAAVAILAAACSSAPTPAPVVQPTPQIVYVTPAPTAAPLPTPQTITIADPNCVKALNILLDKETKLWVSWVTALQAQLKNPKASDTFDSGGWLNKSGWNDAKVIQLQKLIDACEATDTGPTS